jgi:hypothetical protein
MSPRSIKRSPPKGRKTKPVKFSVLLPRLIVGSALLGKVAADCDVSARASAMIGTILAQTQATLQRNSHHQLDSAKGETLTLDHARRAALRLFGDKELKKRVREYADAAVDKYVHA